MRTKGKSRLKKVRPWLQRGIFDFSESSEAIKILKGKTEVSGYSLKGKEIHEKRLTGFILDLRNRGIKPRTIRKIVEEGGAAGLQVAEELVSKGVKEKDLSDELVERRISERNYAEAKRLGLHGEAVYEYGHAKRMYGEDEVRRVIRGKSDQGLQHSLVSGQILRLLSKRYKAERKRKETKPKA